MTKFNPFGYIFVLEEFLKDPSIYRKDDLIRVMKFIKENKTNPNCIDLIDKEINKKRDASVSPSHGGASAVTKQSGVKSDQTLRSEIEKFIETADGIMKKTIKRPSSNLLTVNIVSKIAAMAMIARDANREKLTADKNLDELIKTMPYLLEQLNKYKTALTSTTDETLKKNMKKNTEDIDKVIGFVTDASEKVKSNSNRKPETQVKPSVDFVEASTYETISILKEMLTTKDEGINIAAAKAILAAATAFAAIASLTLIDHTSTDNKIVQNGNKLAQNIFESALNSIYEKIEDSPGSGPDINIQIEETIEILKKLCTPKIMMEIFMKIIYLIEKPNTKVGL